MTLSEKAAYLKGLMDGLNLDTDKAEGKMIASMVELLGDVTKRLAEVEETTIAISDELDEIEDDLDAIEDFLMDEEEEFIDDSCDCDDCDCGCDDVVYQAECACGNIVEFDEDTLELGSIVCDKCGETLEFSFDDVGDEE